MIDIENINKQKEKTKRETFRKISSECDSKIHQKVHLGETQIFLTIPPFPKRLRGETSSNNLDNHHPCKVLL